MEVQCPVEKQGMEVGAKKQDGCTVANAVTVSGRVVCWTTLTWRGFVTVAHVSYGIR